MQLTSVQPVDKSSPSDPKGYSDSSPAYTVIPTFVQQRDLSLLLN